MNKILNMKIILLLTAIMQVAYLKKQRIECNASGRRCVNSYQFVFCIFIGDMYTHMYTSCIITCPKGTICKDCGLVACVPDSKTTTTRKTTTTKTTTRKTTTKTTTRKTTTTPTTTTTTTTTTKPTTTKKPECPEVGFRYPACKCYQYYECVDKCDKVVPELKTCPRRKGFDPVSKICVCASRINCKRPCCKKRKRCRHRGTDDYDNFFSAANPFSWMLG